MRAIVWCDPELKFKIFSMAYILPFLIHYFHIKYHFSLTFTVSCAPRIQKANKQTKKTVHRSFSNQGFFCVFCDLAMLHHLVMASRCLLLSYSYWILRWSVPLEAFSSLTPCPMLIGLISFCCASAKTV